MGTDRGGSRACARRATGGTLIGVAVVTVGALDDRVGAESIGCQLGVQVRRGVAAWAADWAEYLQARGVGPEKFVLLLDVSGSMQGGGTAGFSGEEWGKRCYQDDPDSTSWCGENVWDVYSKSTAKGLDGTRYDTW